MRSEAWELPSQTVDIAFSEQVRLLKKCDEGSKPENLNLFGEKLRVFILFFKFDKVGAFFPPFSLSLVETSGMSKSANKLKMF